MTRRFQFSLETLLLIMGAVAVCCSIWIRLPLAARLVICGTGLVMLAWGVEWLDHRALLDWVVRGGSNQRYVIKRRGESSLDKKKE